MLCSYRHHDLEHATDNDNYHDNDKYADDHTGAIQSQLEYLRIHLEKKKSKNRSLSDDLVQAMADIDYEKRIQEEQTEEYKADLNKCHAEYDSKMQ